MPLTPIVRRFADWVFGFRQHMSWTQADLGAAVGLGRVTISRWENAHTYPDAPTRMRLNQLAREEGYMSMWTCYERICTSLPRMGVRRTCER